VSRVFTGNGGGWVSKQASNYPCNIIIERRLLNTTDTPTERATHQRSELDFGGGSVCVCVYERGSVRSVLVLEVGR
jgi:hypothetical protein